MFGSATQKILLITRMKLITSSSILKRKIEMGFGKWTWSPNLIASDGGYLEVVYVTFSNSFNGIYILFCFHLFCHFRIAPSNFWNENYFHSILKTFVLGGKYTIFLHRFSCLLVWNFIYLSPILLHALKLICSNFMSFSQILLLHHTHLDHHSKLQFKLT